MINWRAICSLSSPCTRFIWKLVCTTYLTSGAALGETFSEKLLVAYFTDAYVSLFFAFSVFAMMVFRVLNWWFLPHFFFYGSKALLALRFLEHFTTCDFSTFFVTTWHFPSLHVIPVLWYGYLSNSSRLLIMTFFKGTVPIMSVKYIIRERSSLQLDQRNLARTKCSLHTWKVRRIFRRRRFLTISASTFQF